MPLLEVAISFAFTHLCMFMCRSIPHCPSLVDSPDTHGVLGQPIFVTWTTLNEMASPSCLARLFLNVGTVYSWNTRYLG